MARLAKATKTTTTTPTGRKRGRPPGTAAKAGTERPAPRGVKKATAPKRASAASPPVAKFSKDELRAQVEKLKRANIKLREKNKEAGRTAHPAAAARIAELEEQVAQLKKGAPPTTPAKRGRKPSATPAKRGRHGATNGNGATEDSVSDE
jgi:hypothetical protein